MFFKHFFYLASTLLLSSIVAQAADICTYTSRSCAGNFGCCYGIAAGTCCTWGQPSGYGWSVRFQSMPAGYFGRTFGDANCVTSTGGVGGGTGACLSVWNAPTYLNWGSARWSTSALLRRAQDSGEGCKQPNVIGYTDPDGKDHLFKVPEGKFAEALASLEAKDYKALEPISERVEVEG